MAIIKIDGNVIFGIEDTDDTLHVIRLNGDAIEDLAEVVIE